MDIKALLSAIPFGKTDAVNLNSYGGALAATPSGLPYAKWVAEGKGYKVIEASATASVAALPTTTAAVTLQNGEQPGGKYYVVHSVFATFEASAAAVESAYIAHVIGANPVAGATNDLGTSIKPLLGGAGRYIGNAIVDLGATVVDDLWSPITTHVSNLVASNGEFALFALIDGMVVLKPGAQYSLETCATTTAVTSRIGLSWFEVKPEELGVLA